MRVLSYEEDAVEIEGVDQALGGTFRLRLEGIRSENPTYYLNGVFQGRLFDRASGQRASQPSREPNDGGRLFIAPVPAVVAAIAALSVVFLVDACVTQTVLKYLDGELDVDAGNEIASGCAVEAIILILGSLGKVVKAVGRIADKIDDLLRSIKWIDLKSILDKALPKATIEELIGIARDFFFSKLLEPIKAFIESLFEEQPPDDPDPKPEPEEPTVPCGPMLNDCHVEYVVRGKVTDEQGTPIAKALVQLKGSATSSVETGSGGTYSISPTSPKAGDYSLSVSAQAFEPQTASVKLAGQPLTRDFKLKKIAATTTTIYVGQYTGTHTISFGSPTPVCSRQHSVTGTLTITLTVDQGGKASASGRLRQDDVIVQLTCPTGPQLGEKNNVEIDPIKVNVSGANVTFDQSQSNSFGGSDGGGVRTERFTFDGSLQNGRIQGTLKELITTTTTGNGSGTYSVTLRP